MRPVDRAFVAQRANFCCEYCMSQQELSHDDFSIEHIIPKKENGSDERENLAFSCQGCNNRKYIATEAIDPVTGYSVSLYNPRQSRWEEHFCWDAEFANVLGLTPSGRATIARLDLNRPRLFNLRRALVIAGKHPPSREAIEQNTLLGR